MHGLQPRILRFLDEVARTGSMRKAADRLNVSASSLNRRILALEADIGVPIFERLPRRLRLTAAGELIIAHARRSLREMERLQGQIDDVKGLRRRELCIAMMAGLASDFLTRLASEFQASHPRVRLKFETNRINDIMAMVLSGDADLGLAFGVKPEASIRILAAVECRLSAIVAPGHPLAQKPAVKLADCVAYPLILPSTTMVFRGVLDDAFVRAALVVDPAVETNEFEMMKRFATMHQGVAILNPVNVDVERRRGELVGIPIHDANLASQTLRLFHRKRSALSVQASQFAEALRIALEEIGPTFAP
jgi:DNA-binding transcriptional LysR family regulator